MKYKLGDVSIINPRETIKKGTIAKKVDMAVLQPFTRKIPSFELLEYKGGTKFRNGDTIMARITPCLENGKTSQVSILDDNEIGFGSTEYIVFRAKEGISDCNFLYYLVCSDIVRDPAIKSMVGSSGRQRVQTDVIQNLEIDLPSLEIQKQIASILSALDEKIEFNNRINENLEQQAQALFKAWFVDFEPFGGVMPDDWIECILDSMCSLIIKGITPKYNEHSAQLVINQKCVRNHQIDLSLARCHEPKKVNEKWLQYGDIVVNSTGTGTLGRAAQVLFTPNNMTVDSHVTIIRASKQEYIYYLGLWATSHEHDFEMLQTGSTGQTDLPRERLKQMQIVLPSDSILSSFSKVIKPIADIRIQKQQENQRLSALRDTLLPKLMNGEIDVSAVQV